MGEIDRPKYQSQKADIDRDIDRLEQAYSALKAQTAQMRIDEGTKKASRELAQEIQDAGKLTASLADATINRVYVYPGNRLEVEWKVREFFSDDTNASP